MNQTSSARGQAARLPATFRERGVAVPYTTPMLQFARARRAGPSAVEILVPSLMGGSGVFVVPHHALPDIVSLSVHDRALHERLSDIDPMTPLTVWPVADRVAATGLAGPRLARRAREGLQADADRPALLFGRFVARLARLLGTDTPDEAFDGPGDGTAKAEATLVELAGTLGLPGDASLAHLRAWADIMQPLGLPDGTVSGPLAARLASMETMADALRAWLADEPTETAEMAESTARAAMDAAGRAHDAIARLARPLADIGGALEKPDETAETLTQGVELVAWLLNGWRRVVDHWRATSGGERWEQRQGLEQVVHHLPVLPSEALGRDTGVWTALRGAQARWRQAGDTAPGKEAEEALSRFQKEAL